MKKSKTVLIIEDDPSIVELVSIHLMDLGFHIESESKGSGGLVKALRYEYDLIILDLMLPELDGLEICKKIRAHNTATPILMLTAKSEELDKVLGLELGADDYITKPFSIREFIARVKAIIRRASVAREREGVKKEDFLQYGKLTIDLDRRTVTLEKKFVDLTTKEFDLLVLFARNPGRAFSRKQLLDLVWGYQFEGYLHTVNTHINRLRSKIEKDPANPQFIKTVWGYGYRFVELGEKSS